MAKGRKKKWGRQSPPEHNHTEQTSAMLIISSEPCTGIDSFNHETESGTAVPISEEEEKEGKKEERN